MASPTALQALTLQLPPQKVQKLKKYIMIMILITYKKRLVVLNKQQNTFFITTIDLSAKKNTFKVLIFFFLFRNCNYQYAIFFCLA